MAKKVVYKTIGYYNKYSDIKLLMGMTTDEICKYAKNRQGHFYENCDGEELDESTSFREEKMESGELRFSTDKKYAILDSTFKGCLDNVNDDGVIDNAFIDIFKAKVVYYLTEEEFLDKLNTLVGKYTDNYMFPVLDIIRKTFDTDNVALYFGGEKKSEDNKFNVITFDLRDYNYSGYIHYLPTLDKKSIYIVKVGVL